MGYSYAVNEEVGDTPDIVFSFSPERDLGHVNRPHTQLQGVDQAVEMLPVASPQIISSA